MTDALLAIILILLFVAVIATAFWPPHRHVFGKIVSADDSAVLRACVCGKTRFYPAPHAPQESSK